MGRGAQAYQYEAFHQHILDTVAAAPASDFTPPIREIRGYMATIFADPMTLPQTVTAASD